MGSGYRRGAAGNGGGLGNPYLEIFLRLRNSKKFVDDARANRLWVWRRRLVRKFAWAVPNDAALETLARMSPLVEIGAGRGYWARLVRERGGEVEAYDIKGSGENGVFRGGADASARYGEGWCLFLCWPPMQEKMASQALSAFRGHVLAYIGEGEGGCTGDSEFHRMLKSGWECTARVEIPRWEAIHDALWVYRRRGGSEDENWRSK